MKHCIIVKWNDGNDKAELMRRAEELFRGAGDIPEVRSVKLVPCCVDRSNRYDLAIVLDMDIQDLPAWDASRLHHEWKDGFGPLIAQKAIFDFE